MLAAGLVPSARERTRFVKQIMFSRVLARSLRAASAARRSRVPAVARRRGSWAASEPSALAVAAGRGGVRAVARLACSAHRGLRRWDGLSGSEGGLGGDCGEPLRKLEVADFAVEGRGRREGARVGSEDCRRCAYAVERPHVAVGVADRGKPERAGEDERERRPDRRGPRLCP